MRCSKVEKRLAEQELGILSPGKKEALDAHLAKCAACRQVAEEFKRSVMALSEGTDIDPPQDLVQRILRHAAREPEPSAPRYWWWIAPALVGAVIIMLVLYMPAFFGPRIHMTEQEVLAGYAENLEVLGFGNTEVYSEDNASDYEEFGIPPEVAKLLI
ncbi:MAG: zf-HC2 domain-containing protein [Deltaproteobacteria bacterium]|nr:zf-HC2 domain-containing protein [Deltaproteobacteria bacterium]MDL1960174.1 zf-HC2 domain-containing protein [Deltaproteobacteria bacterium]